MRTVQCDRHGVQEETFVCQHVVETLRDGHPRGFFWAQPPEKKRPDAWCSACNARVGASSGDWTGEALKKADVKLLCGACYDEAAAINGFNPPAA
jgi:hypothetical protein